MHGPSAESHLPVLPEACLELLQPKPDARVVDGTAGRGGHAALLYERLGPMGVLVLMDQDPAAVQACKARFEERANVRYVHANFVRLEEVLKELDMGDGVDALLVDLGVSSPQFDDAERGFSLQHDGPLDMRMNPETGRNAADLINGLPENELADLFYNLGEERKSRRIARAVVEARREGPIARTEQLATIVTNAVGGRRGRIHPATRVFQALRLAVNEELKALDHLLDVLPRLLRPGGRCAMISFHSLEDRRVKHRFKELGAAGWVRLTKKPIRPEPEEIAHNPRSRSAKLRGIQRPEA